MAKEVYTPRTDAAVCSVDDILRGTPEDKRPYKWVRAQLARELETELIAAQTELAVLRESKRLDDQVMALAAKEIKKFQQISK